MLASLARSVSSSGGVLKALSRSPYRPAATGINTSLTSGGGTSSIGSSSAEHLVSSSSTCSQTIAAAGISTSASASISQSVGQLVSPLSRSPLAGRGPAISAQVSGLTSSFHNLGLAPTTAAAIANATSSSPPPALITTVQTRTFASRRFHRKKIVKAAKGYRGQANRNFRAAIKRVERARQNAYRDRRLRRREFRKLWIQRLNAGVRQHGVRYSRFVNMLNNSEVRLDRKILSDLAMNEPFSFKAVVDVVKERGGDPRQRRITG